MSSIAMNLSLAYWPNPQLNESANTAQGNNAVDQLTLGQLAAFYSECSTGPTYCMVTRRVQELLKRLPPHIEDRQSRLTAAIESAKVALREFSMLTKELN